MTKVRKGERGAIHAAYTIRRTACGLQITRSYQTVPGDELLTCPDCNHLLFGRRP